MSDKKDDKKNKYVPHVYKILISPYYPSFTLQQKVANDDTDDWKTLKNFSSNKALVKKWALEEVERVFEEYDYEGHKNEEV